MKEWSRPAGWRTVRQGLGRTAATASRSVPWRCGCSALGGSRCRYNEAYFDELANRDEPYICWWHRRCHELVSLADTALNPFCQAGAARIGKDTGESLALSRPQPRGDAGATRERRALTRPTRAVRSARTAPAALPAAASTSCARRTTIPIMFGTRRLAWRGVNDPAGAGCGTGSRALEGGRSRPDFSSVSWLGASGSAAQSAAFLSGIVRNPLRPGAFAAAPAALDFVLAAVIGAGPSRRRGANRPAGR
ncbi:hypothetical protein LuPra_05192 [Luteitalea pratensis]|uniref:Uncharacterized protein n=1 Tax=Luteitalea pratensis TaxID=1855912 RepID=A0A143PTK9_LUTPR|nr:hypothetical protein LuPra_05192 [Luteitalea pratensis]